MVHLTLKQKLVGGFMIVATIGLVIGLVGLFGLKTSRKALSEVKAEVEERGEFLANSTDLARSAQVNFKIQVQEWKNTLLRGHEEEQFEKYWARFLEQETIVQSKLKELEALLSQYGVPTHAVRNAASSHLELGRSYRSAIKQYDSGDALAYRVVDQLVKGIDRRPTKQLAEIVTLVVAFESDGASERTAAFEAEIDQFVWITRGAIAFGFVLAIALGFWLGGSLSNRIQEIASSLRAGSDIVDKASAEVSRYGLSIADSTNREAASMQEASASLEVLAENTRGNAKSARSATSIANQTREAVNSGKQQMDEMEIAMTAIRESSDSISQILKSIDEIAFQTNILALNAAVEAARAGEAGAGFAVVADEVRNLAQRSAKAAQETSVRIEDSISKSQQGVEMSSRVSRSLDDILGKASELDELVADIASSVDQNREGVDQVNAAIREIENTYQENAAITEESASSAQELSQQALALNQSVCELAALCGNSEALSASSSVECSPDSMGDVADLDSFSDLEAFSTDRSGKSDGVELWN